MKNEQMKPKQFYASTAWKYFRKYMLLKFSKDGKIVKCSTSGQILELNSKNCHLGHLIKIHNGSKTNYATAFDENNVAPQSLQENHYHGGRPDIMREFLENLHGKKVIDNMYIRSRNICKLDKLTLSLLADIYKNKFNELVKIKGINPWEKIK